MRPEIRRVFLLASAMAANTIIILPAQEPPSQPSYKYEVVSIHRAAPAEMNSGFSPGPQGGLRARNVTALQALTFAYSVQDCQILGAPGWAKSDRFEMSLTPDQSEITPGRETSRPAMDGWLVRQRQRMQAVLRDRFGLGLRTETRELPIYVLTVAKGGHKLKAPAHPERSQTMNINGGRQMVGTTAPTKALAESLSMLLGRPVHDETGLDGAYDFKVDWTPDPTMPLSRSGAGADEPAAGASIFTALTETLGLRLDSKKGPVPVFVIEKIDKPSEN